MTILGIETSCDETAAAVLEEKNGRVTILSNVIASSASLQSKYGGIIPEQAAREQIKSIVPVIKESLRLASLAQGSSIELDAIAVTQGPGLIGSLLVGVETAKVLATIFEKPLIPVNHLMGHFYANWISSSSPQGRTINYSSTDPAKPENGEVPSFPCIGLLVSGGHTDLVLFTDHHKYKYLGGTRDDAAGECFDKCARLLGLPYPGGPEISRLSKGANPAAFNLPRPMLGSKDFDFSFSGLKTAVHNVILNEVKNPSRMRDSNELRDPSALPQDDKANLASSIEAAIIDCLVEKTVRAVQEYKVEQIIVAGGVAANQNLVERLKSEIRNFKLEIKLAVPPPYLCTDNGAMVAAAAFFLKPITNPTKLQADPNLSLS